jgi:hypothetical protein
VVPETSVMFNLLTQQIGREYTIIRRAVKALTWEIPDEVIGCFNWTNPSSRTMALESTQPLTEMSTRNLHGGKGRPVRGADNLTAICEPIVYKMWEPRRLTPYGFSRPVTEIALPLPFTAWVDTTNSDITSFQELEKTYTPVG